MTSFSPKEIQVVSDWGKEELVKSLKVPSAFDIFQSLIQNGEIDIPTISRKLAFKLGSKNGQFLMRLQKFIKTLQREGADSINLQEHKEIYQINLREKKNTKKDGEPESEQETHTVTNAEPNQYGATQIKKSVFLSGNDNSKKTILVTVSFEDKDGDNKGNNNNQETSEKKEEDNSQKSIEINESENIQNQKEAENDKKEDTDDKEIYKPLDIDNDSGDGETENLDPQDPRQQFIEAHKKYLYAREEARFKINQKINYNLNAPKVTFQPRGWQNLFTLTKSSSDNEEEEYEEIETTNILVDDDTPFPTLTQTQKTEDSSSPNNKSRRRRHHGHRSKKH